MRPRLGRVVLATLVTVSVVSSQTPDEIKKEAEARQAVAAAAKAEADARKAEADAEQAAAKAAADVSKAAADARKARAEAELAAIGTLDLGKLRAGGMSVKSDSTTAYIETSILAWSAIKQAATSIAETVKPAAANSSVVLVTTADLIAARELRPYEFQLRQLLTSGTAMNKDATSDAAGLVACPKGPAALAAIPVLGATQAALQLVSLFSTETTYAPVAVSKNDQALHSAILGAGKDFIRCGASIMPAAAADSSPLDLTKPVPILRLWGELSGLGMEIRQKQPGYSKLIDVLASKAVEPSLAACKQLFLRDKATLEQSVVRQNAYLGGLDAMFARLLKVDDGSGTRLLSDLLRAEAILGGDGLFLEAQIVEVAGSTISRKHLLGGSAKVSGGAVVSFRLSKPDGKVLAAGTLDDFVGPVRWDAAGIRDARAERAASTTRAAHSRTERRAETVRAASSSAD